MASKPLRRFGSVAILCCASCLTSCATVVSLLEPNSPKIYGGTRMSLDAQALAESGAAPAYGWTWYPLVLVDLPFGLVMDTALLPVTVPLEMF